MTADHRNPCVCIAVDCIGLGNPVDDCERRRCPFVGERREAEETMEKKDTDRRFER